MPSPGPLFHGFVMLVSCSPHSICYFLGTVISIFSFAVLQCVLLIRRASLIMLSINSMESSGTSGRSLVSTAIEGTGAEAMGVVVYLPGDDTDSVALGCCIAVVVDNRCMSGRTSRTETARDSSG